MTPILADGSAEILLQRSRRTQRRQPGMLAAKIRENRKADPEFLSRRFRRFTQMPYREVTKGTKTEFLPQMGAN